MPAARNTNGKTRKKPGLGVWIQTDQLNSSSSLYQGLEPGSHPLCMIESFPDLTRFRYHKRRLALLLSVNRHIAADLREKGFEILHYRLDDPQTTALCHAGEVACLSDFIRQTGIQKLRVMEASEYDRHQLVLGLESHLGAAVEVLPNDQFLVSRYDFARWYDSVPEPTMEGFYRKRRRETGILMQEDQPLGGRWNYDAENRVPPAGNMPIPANLAYPPDDITQQVIRTVEHEFADHTGALEDFTLPVTRAQVQEWFVDFVGRRLRLFGMYQDAMLAKSNRLYHSYLSPYLNCGLIGVEEVLKAVEQAYYAEEVPINSAEGFIRQILGWREYFHGIYWKKMPGLRDENFLGFHRPVPEMMCTGETHLKCVKCVIDQSRQDAYAHHIQRLMIVGNFALLVGVAPKELVRWMMELYIDSIEWSAIPNVMGMTLYADGGEIGSKPYAASAHYIDKMSDYCHGCHYRERKRVGERACPLNYLYWNFVGSHQDLLKNNPRMNTAIQMYRLKPPAERKLITSSSEGFLNRLHLEGTDKRLKKKVLR